MAVAVVAAIVATLVTIAAQSAAQTASTRAPYEIALSGVVRIRPDGSPPRLIAAVSGILLPNAWSPDGRSLIVLGSGTGLTLVDIATGMTRHLLDQMPVEPFFAWAPDGKRLAFSSPGESGATTNTNGQTPPESAVYVVDIAANEPRRLSPVGQNRFTTWSRDGSLLAYSGTEPGTLNSGIYVVDVKSGVSRRIVSTPTINVAPAWSPRTDEIAFVAAPRQQNGSGDEQSGVFIVHADGTDPRRVWTKLAQGVMWAPDAHAILIRGASNGVLDLGTGATADLGRGLDATFTPDGKSVVYRATPPETGVFIVDANGGNRRELAAAPSFAVSPLFSN